MHGQFKFWQNDENGLLIPDSEVVIPNTIVDEGEESFLKMIMRADVVDVAAGGNFYMGLCNQVPVETDALIDISTEPTAAGGYARQAITRDAVGWPTMNQVNGVWRIISTVETFAASGADFSGPISRAFLCNVASGTAGKLFCYSGALTQAITILDGTSISAQYELFLD